MRTALATGVACAQGAAMAGATTIVNGSCTIIAVRPLLGI
jgi:hypothetical protein